MKGVEKFIQEVKKDVWLRHRWKSKVTKGGYLIIEIPDKVEFTFEFEVMLQMSLEDLSLSLDVHFFYEFDIKTVKVYALI